MNLLNGNKIECKVLYDFMVECIKDDINFYFKNPMTLYCVLEGGLKDSKDFASKKYTELKMKTAKECGAKFEVVSINKFREIATCLYDMIGIAQLPMSNESLNAVNGFSYTFTDIDYLLDRDDIPFLTLDNDATYYNFRLPATVRAVLEILKHTLGDLSGKKIAIVGCRSKTVGAYLPYKLIEQNATISCYHSKSKIKDGEFEDCDAVISCVGKAGLIKQKHFGNNEHCVCIDVGVSRGEDGKVKGDFDLDIRDKQYYTPYINGVGLLTRIYLSYNYVQYMFYMMNDMIPKNDNREYMINENVYTDEMLITYAKRSYISRRSILEYASGFKDLDRGNNIIHIINEMNDAQTAESDSSDDDYYNDDIYD